MLKKIGPYRVEERLGVGGMGEVYKAYDDRLDRIVAIKRIRPDKEAAEDNRERFIREARATARLNHPGIVHVYDIFKDGESLCIVMEYVDGRTLDTMVMEGALESAKVVKLGYEIATGLAEAHAKGIIHRDLKVENIIINEEGNAKILDFGLAKPILSNELDPNLTSKGQLVGTSRAMSPEYVSGEEIDQRSDLFSLGVLLYETSTGHSPFKAQNTLATLKQVMVHEQTPAAEMNSEVPLELSYLIDQLLAKDPEDRPQSAEEVAEELGLLLGQLSSGTITKPSALAPSMRSRSGTYSTVSATHTATAIDFVSRSRWFGAVVVLVILLAIAAWYQFRKSADQPSPEGPTAQQKEKDLIVVANFENTTGDPRLDDSLETAFRVGLEQSRHAEVLSEPQMRAALQLMERPPDTLIDREVGIELSKREGARALITGSIVKIGGVYTVNGTIVDPQDGSTEYTSTEDAKSDSDLIPAVQGVTREIRRVLGESLSAIQKTAPLEKVTTRNVEALKAYSLGVVQLSSTNDDDAAVPLLKRSLRLDSDFAMAHAKLGVYYVGKDPEKAIQHLEKAWSRRDRLTSSEELYVEGWLARIRSTQEEEIRIWSLLSQLHPNDYHGHANVGMAKWLVQYQFEESADALEKALRASGPENYPRILYQLGLSQIAIDDYDRAHSTFERLSDLPDQSSTKDAFVIFFLVTRQYSEAYALIEQILEDPTDPIATLKARHYLSYYWLDQGNFKLAIQQLHELELDRERLFPLLALATYLEVSGQESDAQLQIEEVGDAAQQLLAQQINVNRLRMSTIAMVAKTAARSGNLELAAALLHKQRQFSQKSLHTVQLSFAYLTEGELELARGRPEEALSRAEDARSKADSIQTRETLARIHEELGNLSAAVAQYQWIIDHRGRAFRECAENNCQALNIVAWNLAHYHRGRLLQEMGRETKAIESLRLFVEQWSEGQQLPSVLDARTRLLAMTEPSLEAPEE